LRAAPPRATVGLVRPKILLAALAGLLLAGCGAPPRLASVSRAEPAAEHLLFRDVAVFDGVDLAPHRDVLVSGDTIARVAGAGELSAPAGAVTIAGAGRTLLPGLVDSHTHLFSAGERAGPPPPPEAIAQAFLYAGVTTVLVAAGFGEVAALRAAARDEGALVPRFVTAGPGLSAPGGHPVPLLRAMLPWPVEWLAVRSVVTAATPEEARAAVARIVAEHAPDFVKIIYDDLPPGTPHLSREALEAATDEARRLGAPPIVHATKPADFMDVLDAGAALFVHAPQRGVLSDAEAARIAASGVPVVSTLRLVSASHRLAAEGSIPLEREMLDPALLQAWQDDPRWGLEGFSELIDEKPGAAAEETETNFRKLHAAGVRFFVGTDSGVHAVFPGAALHREMRLLAALGMPPLEVLRAATSAPAAFLAPGEPFGRVAAGLRADLLLVRGDPTRDVAALAEIEEVLVGGVRLARHGLAAGAAD
jgi:imidazolonepropionase-like amidohydrolase